MPILPDSHLPQQNPADGGTAKKKINPNQARDQMPDPVVLALPSEIATKTLVTKSAVE